MKKIFISLLMLATVGSAFAQTPEEKAAAKAAAAELKAKQKAAASQMSAGIKLRDEMLTIYNATVEETNKGAKANQQVIDNNMATIKEKSLKATESLVPAIQSGLIADKKKFDLYHALDDVASQLLNPELGKAANHQDFDTLVFANAIRNIGDGCHGVILYGNPKDEIQKPIIATAKAKLPKTKIYYAYLCMFYLETKNMEGAATALDSYTGFAQMYPEVAEAEEVKNPQYQSSQLAFNIYLTAFNAKKFDLANKYYEQALEFEDEASHNFVVSSRPQMYLQMGDTTMWISSLKDMIKSDPTSTNAEIATQNLMAYYSRQGNDAMDKFADEMLADNAENKMANYGKGYALFSQEKYEEAFKYFNKTVEIDFAFVDGNYMAGMCLYRQAQENYYKKIDGKKFKSDAELKAAENKFVKDLYKEALPFFESCRDNAPEQPERWAGPLENIYKNLGMKEKAEEVAPYIK